MRSKLANILTFLTPVIFGISAAFVCSNAAEDKTTIDPPATRLAKVGHPDFLSPQSNTIVVCDQRVFVANTQADTVDVIDTKTGKVVSRIDVGIDPVCVAVRPDNKEVWVSNHVSDSVSVIDTDSESPTFLHVIATVQDLDWETKTTEFDEPVGIAFASNEKAYVALSSLNKIAVIDVKSRKTTKTLQITSQEPRAIKVRNNRLYVIPFESNNQTQLSGGSKDDVDGERVTFDAWNHSIEHNNVLSLGHVLDIVKHPDVPDKDLFVFDTETDELIETVDTLGTLLYGLTVDSTGNVFISQTDARNDINGRSGTKDHSLEELDNRAFLNQVTVVNSEKDEIEPQSKRIQLEPELPEQPTPDQAFATPFGIEISADDSTLLVASAGSDQLITINSVTGRVLGRVAVDSVPRGIAIESEDDGKPKQAWVHNSVANTISLVDVSDVTDPKVVEQIELVDPTNPNFKRGRIAFNTASASTTGTFSCASCHPDGHTDQLLWVLKTPVVSGGEQIMPRSTMPLRGLRDTAPFHWDGIPGDPYGGINSESIHGAVDPNSDSDDPASAVRHLIDGALASTMSLVDEPGKNDEEKDGLLSAKQRDDLASFLLSVPFPPAQKRPYTNVISKSAQRGFELFHLLGDHDEKPKPNVCGDCHRMPFWVSTNTPGTGMDAPTWRGANDRWLILPQGRLNIIDFDFYRRVAEAGLDERRIWQFSWAGRDRFDPVWNMVLEGSTGFSGALGRQLTIDSETAKDLRSIELLSALETSAAEGAVVLQVTGVLLSNEDSESVSLQFHDDQYVQADPAESHVGLNSSKPTTQEIYTRDELIEMAIAKEFVGTFTARHGEKVNFDHPQPAIWTRGPIEAQRGRQEFPIVFPEKPTMVISGRHIDKEANLIVDGRRVDGTLSFSADDTIGIQLSALPPEGIHFLQIQNRHGLFSNDFIFHVAQDENAAKSLDQELADTHDPNSALASAIKNGSLDEVKKLVAAWPKVNRRHPESGTLPLSTAAIYDRTEIAKWLIENGARASGSNRDGNTPLHIAAFFCHDQMVELLLANEVDTKKKNHRGETALDSVSGDWDEGLEGFYIGLTRALELELDLDQVKLNRPKIAKRLRELDGATE